MLSPSRFFQVLVSEGRALRRRRLLVLQVYLSLGHCRYFSLTWEVIVFLSLCAFLSVCVCISVCLCLSIYFFYFFFFLYFTDFFFFFSPSLILINLSICLLICLSICPSIYTHVSNSNCHISLVSFLIPHHSNLILTSPPFAFYFLFPLVFSLPTHVHLSFRFSFRLPFCSPLLPNHRSLLRMIFQLFYGGRKAGLEPREMSHVSPFWSHGYPSFLVSFVFLLFFDKLFWFCEKAFFFSPHFVLMSVLFLWWLFILLSSLLLLLLLWF